MIKDHFPDGVEIQEINSFETTEFEWKPEHYVAPNVTDGDPDSILELALKELEPETGIYATMSPFSHRVYVHKD
jgi:hypothetical protein